MIESGQKRQAQSWVLRSLFCHVTQVFQGISYLKGTGILARAAHPDRNLRHNQQNQTELETEVLANSSWK